MTELDMTPKSREEQYEEMVLKVMIANRCNRRKARRIIDAIAKKETKKFIKAGKARQAALAAAGKTLTNEDLGITVTGPTLEELGE